MSNGQMLPSSHRVPIEAQCTGTIPSPRILADAFSEFISASSLLESSYRTLQKEVARLSTDLALRNADLVRSLTENRRMRETLQQMLDSMPCGVLVLTSDEKIAMVNPEARRLLGLGGTKVADLRELSRASHLEFEGIARSVSEQFDCEVLREDSEGRRWLSVGRRQLQDCESCTGEKAGGIQSIWILRDITLAKQAEQEREAVRRATTLAEISTILAHEIRNPLASLELFAGLIEQAPQETSQWVAHLRAGIRTLSGTVNNVLSLHGEGRPHLAPIALGPCVESGVEFIRPLADQAGVVLSFRVDDENPSILANEDAIRQIILNLVRNSICHTPEGGRVEIVTGSGGVEDHKRAFVKVSDSGSGIPTEILGSIFDSGFSGTGETPGLGLTVCKRLMNQLGGDIRVTSTLGEGTTFHLEFPIV